MKAIRHELHNNTLACTRLEWEIPGPHGPAFDAASPPQALTVSENTVESLAPAFADLFWIESHKDPRRSLSDILLGRARKCPGVLGITAPYKDRRAAKRGVAALLQRAILSDARSLFIIAVPEAVFAQLWQAAATAPPATGGMEVAPESTPTAAIQVPPDLEERLVGQSAAMKRVRQQIIQAARHPDRPVFLWGATGTGKDTVARAIHDYTMRFQGKTRNNGAGKFVEINVPTLCATLVESELFGHAKGSFSGASADRTGLFQEAQDGTLFINEIQNLSLDGQAKLKQLVEEHRVRPVGANETIEVRARIIAAASQNLDRMVQKGLFSEELFYRLSRAFLINTPALRDHKEDIPVLARHFWRKCTRNPQADLPADVHAELLEHGWAGNVRELEGVLTRLLIEFGANHLRREDVRKAIYLSGGRTTLAPPEPPIDSFGTFKLDCLRHLHRVSVVVRACKRALRPVFIEGRVDAEAAAEVHGQLKCGLFEDLDVHTLRPLLFGSEEAFLCTIALKKQLRLLLDALEASSDALQRCDTKALLEAFEAALSAYFREERRLLS